MRKIRKTLGKLTKLQEIHFAPHTSPEKSHGLFLAEPSDFTCKFRIRRIRNTAMLHCNILMPAPPLYMRPVILDESRSPLVKKSLLSVALLAGFLTQGGTAFADQVPTNSANSANSVAALQANTQAAIISQLHSQVRTLKVMLASMQTPYADPTHADTNLQASPNATITRLQQQVQDLLKQVEYQNTVDNQQAADVAQTVTTMSND
jgi:hypothetical protein